MKLVPRRSVISVAGVLGMLSTSPALAQPAPAVSLPAIEIWGGVAIAAPVSGGTLESRYAPPLLLGGESIASLAAQTLRVDTGWGAGAEAGVNLFLTRRFGVQAGFAYSRATASGANGPYAVSLRYISRQPPDYVAREYTTGSSSPWSDTVGKLGTRSASFGGVVRLGTAGSRFGGTVAAGIVLGHLTGELESLGYTQFVLGGHSTLFATRHRVVVTPTGEDTRVEPYCGGDVSARLSHRVAVVTGLRVRLGSSASAALRADRLVDPNEDTFTPALSEVATTLNVQPLNLPSQRWHVYGGLKVFLW
jgi:hypothetical protein